jgi:hypothetical protein
MCRGDTLVPWPVLVAACHHLGGTSISYHLINNDVNSENSAYAACARSSVLVVPGSPLLGCSPLLRVNASTLVVVQRGNCSFVAKALFAQAAGAVGVLVINSNDDIFTMSGQDANVTLVGAMISQSNGARLLAASSFPLVGSLTPYQRPAFDPSGVALFLVAVFVVYAGAYWAAEEERFLYYNPTSPAPQVSPAHIEPQVLTENSSWAFVFVASAALVTMYFFISYLIYFLIVFFAFGSAVGLTQVIYSCVPRRWSHPVTYVLSWYCFVYHSFIH